MPTYVYECQACGHRFEKFQSMSARVLRKCPECDERKLQRLIGPGAGVLFKGNGFYATDYRSESYRSAEKAESSKGTGEEKGAAKGKKDGSEGKATPQGGSKAGDSGS